jgi:hypothetical protein
MMAGASKRLDTFQLTDAIIQSGLDRIRRAFERGETELMFSVFPSAAPINKPSQAELDARSDEPEWLATLPVGAHQVYECWKTKLKPGGFSFGARIINYPGGMPGDVGLFFSWPKSALEA